MPNTSVGSPLCVLRPALAVLPERLHQVNAEMPILAILIVVLIAVGLGAAVGSASASTYLGGALLGVAAAVVLLVAVGGIVAWRKLSERDEQSSGSH